VLEYGPAGSQALSLIHQVDGRFLFGATNTGLVTFSVTSPVAFPLGKWLFVEAVINVTAGQMSLAVTPEDQTTVSTPSAGAFSGTLLVPGPSIPFSAGKSETLNGLVGSMAGLLVSRRPPTTEERISLFASGSGRRWWEMRPDTRTSAMAAWEFDGSGLDSSFNGLVLDLSAGAPTYASRTVPMLAEGLLAGPLRGMAELIASSVAFQWGCGVSSEGAARDRVYIEAEYDADQLDRPFALVMVDQSTGDEPSRTVGSRVSVRFERSMDGNSDTEASRLFFLHWVSMIVRQMIENAEQSGRLIVHVAEIAEALGVTRPAETAAPLAFASQVTFVVGGRP
jgi:hypothetical protein